MGGSDGTCRGAASPPRSHSGHWHDTGGHWTAHVPSEHPCAEEGDITGGGKGRRCQGWRGTREGRQLEPGCQKDSKGKRGAGERGSGGMSPALPAPGGTSGLFARGGSQAQPVTWGQASRVKADQHHRAEKEVQTHTPACLTPHPETPRQVRVHPSRAGQALTQHRARGLQHGPAVQGKELQPCGRGAAGRAKLLITRTRPHTGVVLQGITLLLSPLCWWGVCLPPHPQQRVGSPR